MSNAVAIKAAAADLASRGVVAKYDGDSYVWISDVVDALAAQNPGWSKAAIKAAIAAEPLAFARADLVGSLPQDKVAASRIETPHAHRGEAHYLVVIG